MHVCRRTPQARQKSKVAVVMIEVFRVPVPKNTLQAIPADERNLLLLASHAVNQISVLRKVLIFSTNYESESELENTLSAGQSQTLLRLLFGALAEAWEMVRRPINQKLIGKDYAGAIEAGGVEAYEKLKTHFGNSNLLHQLRNTLAFHHPKPRELEPAFNDLAEDEDWAWYVSDTINNSFYLVSDMVISSGVRRVTGEADYAKAFGKVMGEVVLVSNEMTDFFLFLMRAIVARHLGADLLSPPPGSGTQIADAPNLYKVAIPFFTVREDG